MNQMDLVQFIKLVGHEQVKAALDQIIAKEQKLDDTSKQLNETKKKSGSILDGMASKVIGFISAWGGFATVLQWVEKYAAALKQSIELLKEFGDSAVDVQKKVQTLAAQMGDISEKGLTKAMMMARDVAVSGSVPLSTGADIMASTASTYPNSGLDFQMKLAKRVAQLAGVNQIDPKSVQSVVELVRASGANDMTKADEVLRTLDAAMKTSPAIQFGPFAEASIKGGAAALAMGLSPQEMMRLMVGARAVSGGSEDVAGETTKMSAYALNTLRRKGHFKAMGIEDAPIAVRYAELERLYQGWESGDPTSKRILEENMRSEQLMRMKMLFSPAAKAQMAEFEKNLPSFTPERLQREVSQFAGTKIGLDTRAKTEIEVARGQMSMDQFKKTVLARVVDEQMKRVAMETPEAVSQMGMYNEEALRDEMAKQATSMFGLGLEGTTLPSVEPAAFKALRGASAKGLSGQTSPGFGPSFAHAQTVNIQNYVEQQVVPNGDVKQIPQAAQNAKPGGQ